MVPQKIDLDGQESFPFDYDRATARALEPGRLARLLARARSASLDDALIAGADPAGSRQLAARALRLTSPRFRTSLADALERLLQAAQGPPSRRRVCPRRRTALANAPELLE